MLYGYISSWNLYVNCLSMFFVGCLIAGPDSVLGAAATQDLCERTGNTASVTTASGIVNGMGSAGAVLQGWLTAQLSSTFGWDSLFYGLMILSILAAIALSPAAWHEQRFASRNRSRDPRS